MSAELLPTIAGVAVTAVIAIITGFWAISKVAMAQFEKRLEARFDQFSNALGELRTVGTQRIEKLEAQQAETEKMVRQILIELPREYVARADYIRHETLIEAKIDQFRLHVERWLTSGGRQQ